MIFGQGGACDKTVVSLKIFDKLDQKKHFLPKLDMAINAEGDNHIGFGRDYNIVDSVTMHVTNLIILSRRDIFQ
jgi:hypothetical protein